MKRKTILSLCFIVAITAVAVGGTIAYFQDIETSVGNRFVAGKLNLKIDNTCHYNGKECVMVEPDYYVWQGTDEQCFCTWEEKDLAGELFFNLLDVKPGDNGEDTISLHIDNNDAWVCAEIANLTSDDNGCESPENKVDATCGAGEGELKENLFFTIWKDIDCDNILDAGEQVLVDNENAQSGVWPIADSNTGAGPLQGGETYCLGVQWNVPLSVGNEIQSDSLIGDVIFTAVQERHMENFVCSDLYTEICDDGIDNDYDGEVDEGCLFCGDGIITLPETCDDNNANAGDGCSASCVLEPGYQCSGEPSVCLPEGWCFSDADCNDGIYCNGIEACGPNNICQPSSGNPCPGPDGDVDCSESCNEANDDCTANDTNESPCPGGTCQSGTCILSCSPTTEVCNGIDDDCDYLVDETFPEYGQICQCMTAIPPYVPYISSYQCVGGVVSCSCK